jgi:transglutaminase-like putative cysteine protease
MKSKLFFVFLACLFTLPVSAQNSAIGPAKRWVKKIGFNLNARPISGQESSVYYLLVDRQTHLGSQEAYEHEAYKLLSTEGVQSFSDLTFEFDPSYSKLTLHQLNIYRDGKVINKLPTSLTTTRREASMERYLYDGSLTCFINITDVRVGDIIEYAYTIAGFNPIYDGHFAQQNYFEYGVPIEQSSLRIVAPADKHLYFKETSKPPPLVITKNGAETEYTWTAPAVAAAISDSNEPGWLDEQTSIQISDFADWKDIAAWALPIYTLKESDEKALRQVVDPELLKGEPLSIIRFVQDRIRYLSLSVGTNSHKPHQPALVYKQRFGDCKDKSMLLCALLHLQNIEAHPVLIATVWKSTLDTRQPQINAFNHCVVQITLNGSVFYVDPTISGQGGTIGKIPFPNYRRGLVIAATTQGLTELPIVSRGETNEYLDYTLEKVDGDATLDVRTIYHGSDADNVRSEFAGRSRKDTENQYRKFYGNVHPTLEVSDSITFTDDRDGNEFAVNEHYVIPHAWKLSMGDGTDSVVQFEIYSLSMESYVNISKSESRTAPYAISYPVNMTSTISVYLPSEWSIRPNTKQIREKEYAYSYSSAPSLNRGLNAVVIETTYSTFSDNIPRERFQKFVKDHEAMFSNLSYFVSFNKSINSSKTGPAGAIILALYCLVLIWLSRYIYQKYGPEMAIPGFDLNDAEPIGGWLILLGIVITISPLRLLFGIFSDDFLLTSLKWPGLLTSGKAPLALILLAEQFYNFGMLAFSILLVVTFYKRRTSFPRLAIIFFSAQVVGLTADALATNGFVAESQKDTIRTISSVVIAAMIWIPYLIFSSRVKETFVFGGDTPSSESSITPVEGSPPGS